MKKTVYTALAALSLVATSTMAAAATAPAPVVTPLTQPASENVAGANQLIGSGIGAVFGVAAVAALVATVVLAIKTGDKGDKPPVVTSP